MYRIEYKDRMLGWVTIAAGPYDILTTHYGEHLSKHQDSYKMVSIQK